MNDGIWFLVTVGSLGLLTAAVTIFGALVVQPRRLASEDVEAAIRYDDAKRLRAVLLVRGHFLKSDIRKKAEAWLSAKAA